MSTTEDLRAALADGDTPAGIDLGPVRRRARRLRRGRIAAAGTATALVAALAVAVPYGLLRSPGPTPADAPAAAPSCPDQAPDQVRDRGPADRLVPFAPDRVLVCGYSPVAGRLFAAGVLTASEARDVLTRLDRSPPQPTRPLCTSDAGPDLLLRVAGAGRTASLLAQTYGCGTVTNGVRRLGGDKRLLSGLLTGPSTAGCPARGASRPAAGARPGDTLLPAAADTLLLCRYETSQPQPKEPPTALVHASVLAGRPARELVARLNALPTGPPPSCPSAGSPAVLVVTAQPDATGRVTAHLTGCPWATNGSRIAYLDEGVRAELASLTR
jgi:hypothetical protein